MAGEKGHLVGDEVAAAALRRDDHGPLGPPGGLGSSRRRRRGGGDLAPDGATRAAAGPPGVRSRAAAGPHGGGGGDEYGRSRRERHRLHGLTARRRWLGDSGISVSTADEESTNLWCDTAVVSSSHFFLCGCQVSTILFF